MLAPPDPIYTGIMLAAVGVAVTIQLLQNDPSPLPRQKRALLAMGALLGAALLAKVPMLLNDPRAWWDPILLMEGGKTITFGMVGGYAGVEAMKRLMRIRYSTGDRFAVSVPAGVAVGRLACFYGGCCYGTPTDLPWAVIQKDDSLPRHPTQFYGVASHLTAAAVLWNLRQRGIFRNRLIETYFVAYFVYRFFTEFIRPEPVLALGLTIYQWASLAFAPMFAFIWWRKAQAEVPTTPVPTGAATA